MPLARGRHLPRLTRPQSWSQQCLPPRHIVGHGASSRGRLHHVWLCCHEHGRPQVVVVSRGGRTQSAVRLRRRGYDDAVQWHSGTVINAIVLLHRSHRT
jgi:hypothetical protein